MLKYYLLAFVLIITSSCKTLDTNLIFIQNTSSNVENHIENNDLSIYLPENYFLNKVQGKDGVIYYFESTLNGTVKQHEEIFFGFYPGNIEKYYNNKIETISTNVLNQERNLGIYFEKNVYSTIIIVPLNNEIGHERYIRIIGIANTKEELYKLINVFSTLIIK
jgi:hypothetical protein